MLVLIMLNNMVVEEYSEFFIGLLRCSETESHPQVDQPIVQTWTQGPSLQNNDEIPILVAREDPTEQRIQVVDYSLIRHGNPKADVVPIFSLRPPPLLDAKRLCKTKAEEEPLFKIRPPPYLDDKINSSCYPVEADWAHLNEDPLMSGYLKMRELNVEIRRREKNDFIAAKGKGWKIQA